MNMKNSRPNSWEEEMEAPGLEETKAPLLSLLFSAIIGFGVILFVATRTIAQMLFTRKPAVGSNPVLEISKINR